MMSATSGARSVLLGLYALLGVGSEARPQTAVLLAEEPEGTIEVTGESRVVVAGLVGEIAVQRGPGGVLSFQSRWLDQAREHAPVALRLDGEAFRIGPSGATGERPVSVVLSVPPELLAEVEASGSKVKAAGLLGGLRVRGARLDVQVDWCEGRVFLDVDTGAVRVSHSQGETEIRGREVTAAVTRASGRVSLRTTGGRIDAREVGGVEGETEATQVTLDGTHGPVRLDVRGGSVEAKNLALGGEFHMSRARLSVRRSRGPIEIESDDDVRFAENDTVRVTGYGATVVGSSNAVSVEVHGDGGTVSLETIGGTTTVSGSGLDLSLRQVTAARVDVASSQVRIDGVGGPLEVSGESSDLQIVNAAQDVTVRSRAGDVRVLELMGAAQIQAEGDRVEVSFGTQYIAKSSTVRNDGGSVAVTFPAGAACRVEAETRYGRIESEFPGIEVSAEGTKASGSLGPQSNLSTLVRIVAERDITLSTRRAQE